jgi:hypothetical protein
MSRSSARRGQVEPTAALAAVFGVVVGLGLYAGVLADATPADRERDLAGPAVERVHDRLAGDDGVAHPDRLSAATDAGPDGYRLNATLRVAALRWTVGPRPPPTADAATRRTSVRIAPGRIDPGVLRVEVWA